MSDDQKYEVVASVKIGDLMRKQKARASLLDGIVFVLLWGFYYWYFVFGAIENSHQSLLDTAKSPELAHQENWLKNIYFYTACILGILPILGFLVCWDSYTSSRSKFFWLTVLTCNLQVLGKTFLQSLVIIPLLMALTSGGGFLLITYIPDTLRNVPWIGSIVLAGGIIIFIALAVFASLLSALFIYFFNLHKKLSMINATAEVH